jgi:hypothetical protein
VAAAIRAGAFYALVVFLIGFIFGTIRVLLLAPRLGETAAVSLEALLMLAASWFVCRWCVDGRDVPRTVPARCLMGAAAFVVLMSAEFILAVLVFGRSTAQFFATYASVPGAIGLAAQIVFATIPVVQVWRR